MNDENALSAIDPNITEKKLQEFKPSPLFSKSLIPKNVKEAMELSTILSKSNLVPKEMIGRPEACFVAIGFGMEIGLPPMQAIQNIMVVNGRPSVWGDAALALIQGSGMVEEWYEDSPDTALQQGYGRAILKLYGKPPVERRFSIDDAKRAGLWGKTGPWSTYPGRMLQMRARSWTIRDAAPGVLKGIQVREEVLDYSRDMETSEVKMPERKKPAQDSIPGVIVPETEPSTKTDGNVAGSSNVVEIEAIGEPDATENMANDAIEPGNAPGDDQGEFKISEERRKQLFQLRAKFKIGLPEVKEYLKNISVVDTSELTNKQADAMVEWIIGKK